MAKRERPPEPARPSCILPFPASRTAAWRGWMEAEMAKSKETAVPAKNNPCYGVYVVEGEGDRSYWTKVGAAWPHNDGDGFNVTLTALPLSGRLVIHAKKEQ